MKKCLISVIVLLFVVNITHAQKFSGGIEVSPQISWMKPEVSKKIDNEGVKLGFNFGLIGDYNFSDNFAFSTGIMVNNFGGKLNFSDSIVDFKAGDTSYDLKSDATIEYKLQYVEIPLSLKGKTNEIGYMTYFMKAGVSPMFRWKAKGDANQQRISDESIKDEVRAFNLGFNVGGGFEYSLGGTTKLLVELVFTNGLTNITQTDDKIILNSLALRTGILF